MTYLFFVQGEGRGHLTQALTVKAKLESRGHSILAVIAGPEPDYKLPAFFESEFSDKLIRISSPRFVMDKTGSGISMAASIVRTVSRFAYYVKSLRLIKKSIAELNPDAIINFYEPLAGIYSRLYSDRRPLFCVAHQFFLEHAAFQFPRSLWVERFSIKLYNWLAAPLNSKIIALSFTEEIDDIKGRVFICPPLIRQAIRDKQSLSGNFILAYLLNPGYSRELISWSKKNSDVKIEAFWNNPNSDTTIISPSLIFHHLHGEKFINLLANCRAYASTAGFESICEAAYLQKNILMIPTKNHFEQRCNATDAIRANIAASANSFDFSLLSEKQSESRLKDLSIFRNWVDNFDNKIYGIIENI